MSEVSPVRSVRTGEKPQWATKDLAITRCRSCRLLSPMGQQQAPLGPPGCHRLAPTSSKSSLTESVTVPAAKDSRSASVSSYLGWGAATDRGPEPPSSCAASSPSGMTSATSRRTRTTNCSRMTKTTKSSMKMSYSTMSLPKASGWTPAARQCSPAWVSSPPCASPHGAERSCRHWRSPHGPTHPR